jgi:hypothetical protein
MLAQSVLSRRSSADFSIFATHWREMFLCKSKEKTGRELPASLGCVALKIGHCSRVPGSAGRNGNCFFVL